MTYRASILHIFPYFRLNTYLTNFDYSIVIFGAFTRFNVIV